MKELHVYLKNDYSEKDNLYTTYKETNDALSEGNEIVHTTQTNAINSKWLARGYRLFVHFIDGSERELFLGLKNEGVNNVRTSTNLEKLVLNNFFGEATEFEDEKDKETKR